MAITSFNSTINQSVFVLLHNGKDAKSPVCICSVVIWKLNKYKSKITSNVNLVDHFKIQETVTSITVTSLSMSKMARSIAGWWSKFPYLVLETKLEWNVNFGNIQEISKYLDNYLYAMAQQIHICFRSDFDSLTSEKWRQTKSKIISSIDFTGWSFQCTYSNFSSKSTRHIAWYMSL